MLMSLRRAIVLVVMALALLAGLFGWTVRMEMMPLVQHHPGTHTTNHTLAWYCFPPPFEC